MREEMCVEKGFARHDGSDYYNHLVAVTQDLIDHGVNDEVTLTASLLHDAVEDIEGVSYKMVADKFGEDVAEVVQKVTKADGVNYREQGELLNYLAGIREDVRACLIKTSDWKHNFGTMKDATQEKKLRKVYESEEYFIPFFKECRNKYPRYAGYFFSAKTTIEPHLWEIKEHYETVEALRKEVKTLKGVLGRRVRS